MKLVIPGDCLERMREMEENSIDFIVTDPPYGLSFMGKDWDHGIPGTPFWQEALRVSKPGSMLAAFGGTRTYHRLTCAIEDAGWEIRDCISWLYGSGFPKSHNNFGLPGYGTALKPAWEPIILAMKPLDGTFAKNVEKWGVAGINIDDCRIGIDRIITQLRDRSAWHGNQWGNGGYEKPIGISESRIGRWPANLILDEEAAEMLDQQSGNLKTGSMKPQLHQSTNKIYSKRKFASLGQEGSSGGASRFFYCAKASSAERNAGLEGMPLHDPVYSKEAKNGQGLSVSDSKIPKQNNHPTVKPLAIMKYIIKLLAPPADPILLDPFAGSGSTLVAAKQLGIRAIGIEKNPEYCEIAQKRVENAKFVSTQLNLFK